MRRVAIAVAMLAAAAAQAETPVERGAYLVRIMDCTGCHTNGALAGKPEEGMFLAGSVIGFGMPGLGVFYPKNITPHREAGIGKWSEEDIVTAIRSGLRPDGRELAPIMPWRSYAGLTDEDARAVAAYLKSLPAIDHQVPRDAGPNETAAAPYLGLMEPQTARRPD